MNVQLDMSLAHNYHSPSQIARVITEGWMASNMYCPRCGESHLRHFTNNRPVADFYCSRCKNQFELKGKHGKIARTINDGAYRTMVSRIMSNTNPDFFVMEYRLDFEPHIENLLLIPKFFFTPSIITKRPPLSETARRAGWIGCSIDINSIPNQGKISIVRQGQAISKQAVLRNVGMASRLALNKIESRGWLFDTLSCINKIPNQLFSLADVYSFSDHLARLHPQNHNVNAKIRQQLQLLRDKGFIIFLGSGKYKKANSDSESDTL